MPRPDLRHVRVVLVRPRQPGNVGAAARAVANHGLGRLVLVDPPGFDPDRARWMAPTTEDVVNDALFTATVDEAIADCALVIGTTGRSRRWDWPTWGPAQLARTVRSPDWSGQPIALLFGPEDFGLANADLTQATALLRLPTTEHASLNLAQAVTVTCAALLGDAPSAPAPERDLAPVGLRARFTADAIALLTQAGYLAGRSPQQVEGTLVRMIARGRPSRRELAALLGMIADLRWKLDHPGS